MLHIDTAIGTARHGDQVRCLQQRGQGGWNEDQRPLRYQIREDYPMVMNRRFTFVLSQRRVPLKRLKNLWHSCRR